VHSATIPTLGGVAIFIGITISSIVATDGYSFDELKYIMAAVILMFFIGLKDDILGISPLKKFAVQVLAALILILLGDIRFTNLQGVFGVWEVNYFVSFICSFFFMILIINAFNLIDGVDGLASATAVIASSSVGVWFYLSGHIQLAILSFAISGSLVSFFIYNVFGTTNKLFMGDTGSLIVGILISAITIKFIELNLNTANPFYIRAVPSVSFGILIIPLIDTIRIFSIRISNGTPPFLPDKNHIHHKLQQLLGSHLKVTSILIAINLCFISVAFALSKYGMNVNFIIGILIMAGLALAYLVTRMVAVKNNSVSLFHSKWWRIM
jgi:UDP-N-acetylmuramyl pentapeptide phosphotransferase/UDP-N-acetylglucosamine-1-phosphate transferase